MKIALFDTGHFETAYTLIRLFDQPGNQLTIFTNGQTAGILKDMLLDDQDRFDWIVIDRWISNWNYFLYTKDQLATIRPDLIYLNTIDRGDIFYAILLNILPHTRVILTIHDVNCFFYKGRFPALKDMLKYTGRKWLMREVESLNVNTDTMVPYLRARTNNRIPVLHIPGAVFENVHFTPTDGRIRLVVPGSIDQKRRNYDDVFLLAELCEEAALPVDITLAGGYMNPYGKSVIMKSNQWKGEHCRIAVYSGEMVPQPEYDSVMRNAHFIFTPIVVNTKICGDIPEIYGITKSSGSISDAMRHAKPIIVPENYKITPKLESSCFSYRSLTEVTALLYKIFNQPAHYSQWQNNALKNAEWFSISAVRERNVSLFFRDD